MTAQWHSIKPFTYVTPTIDPPWHSFLDHWKMSNVACIFEELLEPPTKRESLARVITLLSKTATQRIYHGSGHNLTTKWDSSFHGNFVLDIN